MNKRGRPKGSKNKTTLEQFQRWDAIAKKYKHPFEHLFAIGAGKDTYPVRIGDQIVQMKPTVSERMAALTVLLRYRHPLVGNSDGNSSGQFSISWEGDQQGQTIDGEAA